MQKVLEGNETISILMKRYPELEEIKELVWEACSELIDTFQNGGKLLVCGNGGSASDADHIVAELMKSFKIKRSLNAGLNELFCHHFGKEGGELASKLEGALPAISLSGSSGLITAIANDVDHSMIFAQQVYGYGRKGDALLLISTSGNSENVLQAAKVGKAIGLKTIALTGRGGGRLSELCECNLCMPSDETYRIQEFHIAVYHAICMVVERNMFGTGEKSSKEQEWW